MVKWKGAVDRVILAHPNHDGQSSAENVIIEGTLDRVWEAFKKDEFSKRKLAVGGGSFAYVYPGLFETCPKIHSF